MNANHAEQLATLFNSPPQPLPDIAGGEFVIYGAGNFGRLAGSLIEQAGGKILFYLDKEKKQDFPWPVKSLQDISRPNANVRLVIGIFNAYVDLAPVISALKNAGFTQFITPTELFRKVDNLKPPSQYWLSTPTDYHQHRAEITECLDYFSDDISRQLFVSLWRYRLWGKLEDLPTPSPVELQYFPADVPSWKLPLRMIDCGAYTGDTLHFIRNHKIPTQAIAAFEPDPGNYKKLVACFGEWPEVEQCVLVPCGVYNSAALLKFSADGGAGSSITEQGNITIQCISIDECLPTFNPNLIKMDIEGAEVEALLGAEKTIKSSRPGLAISLYHTPHHIWQIPRLLHNWGLSYNFFLRTHLHQEFETVLYALPR